MLFEISPTIKYMCNLKSHKIVQQGLLLDMKVTEKSQGQGYGNGALGQVSNLECYGKYSKADIVLIQVLIVLQIGKDFKLKFLCKIFIRLPY